MNHKSDLKDVNIQSWLQTLLFIISVFLGGWTFHQKILDDIDARMDRLYHSFDSRVNSVESDVKDLRQDFKDVMKKS